MQIGKKLTNGYGAGTDPSIGKSAAAESEEELTALVKDFDMIILTCGMGGGTGTGATPFLAKLCKDAGILTVAVVTTPFTFESMPRTTASQAGIEELKQCVDTLLVIPNDKLLTLTDKPFFLQDAFSMADTVLKYTIEGITNIIFNRGLVNLDFNDLRTTLLNKGVGHLGIGTTTSDGSILEALNQAIHSPLLETTISGASNILINSSGNINITELNEAISHVRELAGNNVNIIWGTVAPDDFDPEKIVVTLIATGMNENHSAQKITIPPLKQPMLHQDYSRLKLITPTKTTLDIPTFLQTHMK